MRSLSFSLSIIAMLFASHGLALADDAGEAAAATDALYKAKCRACHGATLEGGFGPGLKNDAVAGRWAKLGSEALADHIRVSMPPGEPGSLTQEQARGLARLIAQVNGFAAADKADDEPVQNSNQQDDLHSAAQAMHGSNPMDQKLEELGAADVQRVAPPMIDARYKAEIARRQELAQALTPVSNAEIENVASASWPAWRGGSRTLGFSALDTINRSNAAELKQAWVRSLPQGGAAISPIVHDGVMFLNVSGTIMALDATSGDTLWTYEGPTENSGFVPHSQPRNIALYEDKLFVPTLNGQVIALEARSGKPIWTQALFPESDELQITAGPVMANGKVIQGVSGCSYVEAKCFVAALDSETGEELWRFNTIPGAGEPGGKTWNGAPMKDRTGGAIWTPPTYDPETNLVYVGVAQTYKYGPLLSQSQQDGHTKEALYTDSTLAFDADTGELAWYYQHMPTEIWDLDWSFERMLMTVDTPQGPRRAVVNGGKIAVFDALDASTGEYLFSFDLGMQSLVTAIDPQTGAKTINPGAYFEPGAKAKVCPDSFGARNWPSTAYDPGEKLLFIPMFQTCGMIGMSSLPDGYFTHEILDKPEANGLYGRLVAYDMANRRIVWTNDRRAPEIAATLATAGGILFAGSSDRTFRALDSSTGKELWGAKLDEMPASFPATYAVNGKQYVAVITGSGTPLTIYLESKTPENPSGTGARSIWVFALD